MTQDVAAARVDLERLAKLAEAVIKGDDSLAAAVRSLRAFHAAATPATVLALLAENAALRAEVSQANANGASHWSRATAAEAKLARAVEGLERIVHWRVEMTGTPVDTEAANAWAITFDTAATEASQTLAALQQGTQDQ